MAMRDTFAWLRSAVAGPKQALQNIDSPLRGALKCRGRGDAATPLPRPSRPSDAALVPSQALAHTLQTFTPGGGMCDMQLSGWTTYMVDHLLVLFLDLVAEFDDRMHHATPAFRHIFS